MFVPRQSSPGRRRSGRGLMELLVVAAISIIATVLLTRDLGLGGGNHTLAACQGNLQKVYLALSIYQNDNKGAFPLWSGATNPAQPLSLLVPKCTTDTGMFICPGSDDKPLPEAESFAARKISYAYYVGWTTNDDENAIIASDAQVDAAPKNAGQQIFSEDGKKPGNNHGKVGGNLLTRGGSVGVSGPKAARDVRYPSSVILLNP